MDIWKLWEGNLVNWYLIREGFTPNNSRNTSYCFDKLLTMLLKCWDTAWTEKWLTVLFPEPGGPIILSKWAEYRWEIIDYLLRLTQ